MMADDRTQILAQCYHCGNEGFQTIKGKASEGYEDYADDYGSYVVNWECTDTFMLQCPVCEKITLYSEFSTQGLVDQHGNQVTVDKIEYPANSISTNQVPSDIKSSFEAALKVKAIQPELCMVSLRMVLEAVCNERGAEGKDLEQKIADLVKKGILPSVYNDACWIIRQLGNKAVHIDTTSQRYKKEVVKVIDFMQTIINYLYVFPEEVSALKTKIESEKKQAESE